MRIGRAICEALAARGCDVVVHCNRSRREATQLVSELKRSGVSACVVEADLSDNAACRRVFRQAWKLAGGLDFLVNNAAIFVKDVPRKPGKALAREMANVNMRAPAILTELLAGAKRPARGGVRKVVNLLDRRIVGDDPETFSYTFSKKMLATYTVTAARKLAPHVVLNGVAPGAVLPPPARGGAYTRELAGKRLLEHRCTPQDVADAVVFLLEADAVTGQIIFVDSGQHLITR